MSEQKEDTNGEEEESQESQESQEVEVNSRV
jgi:hypothetical protein